MRFVDIICCMATACIISLSDAQTCNGAGSGACGGGLPEVCLNGDVCLVDIFTCCAPADIIPAAGDTSSSSTTSTSSTTTSTPSTTTTTYTTTSGSTTTSQSTTTATTTTSTKAPFVCEDTFSGCGYITYMCNDAQYYDKMKVECPKTCGWC